MQFEENHIIIIELLFYDFFTKNIKKSQLFSVLIRYI